MKRRSTKKLKKSKRWSANLKKSKRLSAKKSRKSRKTKNSYSTELLLGLGIPLALGAGVGVWYYLKNKNRNYIIIKKNHEAYIAELYINNKKEEINFYDLSDLIGRIKLLLFSDGKTLHFIKLISTTNKSFESSSSKNPSNNINNINLDEFFNYKKPIEYEIIIGNELKDGEKWSVFELKSFL